jgi:hypothetical protein
MGRVRYRIIQNCHVYRVLPNETPHSVDASSQASIHICIVLNRSNALILLGPLRASAFKELISNLPLASKCTCHAQADDSRSSALPNRCPR